MNLLELKNKVDRAVEYANECGQAPAGIPVTIQMSDFDAKAIWTTEVELHYDNNLDASGCVLAGDIDYFLPLPE